MEGLIKNFSNLKTDWRLRQTARENLAILRLNDEEWKKLIDFMNKTYSSGITEDDYNDVFSSWNIDQIRKMLGRPLFEDEVYPKYYKVTSEVKHKVKYVYIDDDLEDKDVMTDDDFLACSPEYLGTDKPDIDDDEIDCVGCIIFKEFRYDENEMWNEYNIPAYAIYRIAEKVANKNGQTECWEVPDTHALNELNRDFELTKEDKKNIDRFLKTLDRAMPDGYTISWDSESCGSPFFHPYPEFGLGMDCVIMRVYPKNLERLKV